MEKLIILAVVVAASLLHGWIQRKQQEAEEAREASRPKVPPPPIPRRGDRTAGRRPEAGGAPVPPPVPPVPAPARSWEDELRRLLEGDSPATTRPSAPVPPPPPLPRPVVTSAPSSAEPAAPRPFLARSSIPVPDEGAEMEVGLPVRPVEFHQASAAHDRASAMQVSVARRIHDAAARVTSHAGSGDAQRVPAGAAAGAALANMLRDRGAQRTAILTAIVLGPPRSLASGEPGRL